VFPARKGLVELMTELIHDGQISPDGIRKIAGAVADRIADERRAAEEAER
jgi:hypothetical protein